MDDDPRNEAEQPRTVPLAQRHQPVPWLLKRLHAHIDALREIVRDVLPQIQAIDDKRLGADGIAAVDSLSVDRRAQLGDYVEARYEAAIEALSLPVESDDRELDAEFAEPGVTLLKLNVDLDIKVLHEIFEHDRHHMGAFMRGLEKLGGPSRTLILRNSLLAQAVGGFEVFIAGLAARFYVEHPEALEQSDGAFTLADIRTFEDVDDAADELVARRVAALMRGSLDDWAKWFSTHCSADFQSLAMDWQATREVFQRRHVIMHNGGLVSRQYLSHVQSSEPPRLGQRLGVNVDYLERALDELDVLGTALGVRAWGTWFEEERDRSSGALLQRTYDLMLDERWHAVDQLAQRARPLKCVAAIAEPIKCNGWHSRSVSRGPQSVRKDVEAWDTSALAGRFRLVQAVLLEEFERALEMVPGLVQTGEVTAGELHNWPILGRLRQQPGYEAVYATLVKSEATPADKEEHGPLAQDSAGDPSAPSEKPSNGMPPSTSRDDLEKGPAS